MKISKIRKNVALPPISRGNSLMVDSKYPFHKMEVDDSFTVSGSSSETTRALHARVQDARKRYQHAHKQRKFTVRTLGRKLVGVWRTK